MATQHLGFAVTRFGGRTWTAASALLLLFPTGLLAVCVSNPDTPYWMFLVAAAFAGLGGAVVQLAVPPVISLGTGLHLAWAGLMWMPLIIAAFIAALQCTDNFTESRSDINAYREVLRHRDTWRMAAHSFWLFLGSFLWLFVTTGVGNGSTYQLIRRCSPRKGTRRPPSARWAASAGS